MKRSKVVRAAGITGIGRAIPDKVLTNADLEKMVDTSDEWIVTRTGIRERRIAEENIASSDLGLEAARKALENAGVEPEEIDLIIVATITPDMAFPATASLIQDKLGATRAGAFDLSAGCSGFVYALDMAASRVMAGIDDTVLVVGVDVLSKIVDFTDRSTCILFGDGAGAVVVQPVEEGYGVLASYLGSDGSMGHTLLVPAGGSRKPASEETVRNREHYICMSGQEVFKFAVRIMADASLEVLHRADLQPEDIDLFIPHQANIRIIQAAAKRLALPPEKVFVNVDRYGNTSAASIPIALDEALEQGLVKRGDNLVLVGFGAGLSWASVVLKWSK